MSDRTLSGDVRTDRVVLRVPSWAVDGLAKRCAQSTDPILLSACVALFHRYKAFDAFLVRWKNRVHEIDVCSDSSFFELVSSVEAVTLRPKPQAEILSSAAVELDIQEAEGLVEITYPSNLFDRHRIIGITDHFSRLIESANSDPSTSISRLAIMTDEEARQIASWSRTTRDCRVNGCIHEIFEEQARQLPNHIAVSFNGHHLTYAQLNEQSNRLAHRLRAMGVGAESIVALSLGRSVELIVGVLSVLKAGGAYLPIDPDDPWERVASLCEETKAVVLLVDRPVDGSLPWSNVLRIDVGEAFADESSKNPIARATPSNLAYVLFTSGTTGRPKGVAVTHANVIRLIEAGRDWFDFSSTDVFALWHSYTFDASVFELWHALLNGARLVVVPYFVSRSPDELRDLLVREQVTVFSQTPSAFRGLESVTRDTKDFALRWLILGGEVIDRSSLHRWFDRNGDARPHIVNAYGPTETTVDATYRRLRATDTDDAGSVIGRPLADVEIHVLDRNLAPVPIGVPGEIHVGGACLARGYFAQPKLTQERFIRHPFSEIEGARLYRTGDLGSFLPDGDLLFLGRIDRQIKIRGHRVELQEIESVLKELESVESVVVVIREDSPEEKRLVAYVVGSVSIASLRAHLRVRLPGYMLPHAIVPLEALPLGLSGKIDPKSLPSPDRRHFAEESYVAPADSTESMLAGIWSSVLASTAIGMNDDFFTHGGDSFSATRLVDRLRVVFGSQITLRTVYENSTPAQMTRWVRAHGLDASAHSREVDPPLVAAGRNGSVPLSCELHWHYRLAGSLVPDFATPLPAALQSVAAFDIRGPFDFGCFERSLETVMHRQEILRTTIAEREGLVLEVAERFRAPIERLDLSGMMLGEQEDTIRTLCQTQMCTPIDLANAFTHRWLVIHRAADQHLLFVAFTYLLDWAGFNLMIEELATVYNPLSDHLEPTMPPVEFTFADYALWQQQRVASGLLASAREAWVRELDPKAVIARIEPDPRLMIEGDRSVQHPADLVSADVSAELSILIRRPRDQRATVGVVSLAAAQLALLSASARHCPVQFALPTPNRDGSLSRIVGSFPSELLVRVDFSGCATLRHALDRVREAYLVAAEKRAQAPSEVTNCDSESRECESARSILFNYQVRMNQAGMADANLAISGASSRAVGLDELGYRAPSTMRPDLMFLVLGSDFPESLSIKYRTDRYPRETIVSLLNNWAYLWMAILDRPDQLLAPKVV